MKKIAIVAHGLSGGGAERVASIIANYFVKNSFDVLYVAAYNDKKEYFIDKKVQIHYVRSTSKNKLVRLIERNIDIYKAIKKFNAEIVFSFITNELLLTELNGIPIVFSLRNDPQHIDNSPIASLLRKFAYFHAKNIVFQTQGAANFFSEKIQEKGVIIANPIDVNILPYWHKHEHNNVFISACRLTEQKNLPMLFEAFADLHKEYPEYILEIYGEGIIKDELLVLIEKLNAKEFIILKGRTNKIHEIMATSFAYVMSSDYEGLSNAMLEALCIGIPSICTDCPPGGAKAFIENEINGILTPVGDKHSMYEKMKFIIENKSEATKYSTNSIQIRNDLNVDVICEKWAELIK